MQQEFDSFFCCRLCRIDGHHAGPPVCAVVHGWDCGVEARRLLLGSRGGVSAAAPTEVICTAEVGEDLFQFVRW